MNKCKSCSDPLAPGWHVDDDAGITFGGLKKSQNEAMEEIAQYIAHIYFTKSTEVFNDLMENIANETLTAAKFGGYSETCEWLGHKALATCDECFRTMLCDEYDDNDGICNRCKPKADDWCASCNYLLPVADYIRRDDSDIDEPLCAECLARVNGGN